jgi:hypothetical protein
MNKTYIYSKILQLNYYDLNAVPYLDILHLGAEKKKIHAPLRSLLMENIGDKLS